MGVGRESRGAGAGAGGGATHNDDLGGAAVAPHHELGNCRRALHPWYDAAGSIVRVRGWEAYIVCIQGAGCRRQGQDTHAFQAGRAAASRGHSTKTNASGSIVPSFASSTGSARVQSGHQLTPSGPFFPVASTTTLLLPSLAARASARVASKASGESHVSRRPRKLTACDGLTAIPIVSRSPTRLYVGYRSRAATQTKLGLSTSVLLTGDNNYFNNVYIRILTVRVRVALSPGGIITHRSFTGGVWFRQWHRRDLFAISMTGEND